MREPASLPTVPVTPRIIPADTVYAALNDSCRSAVLAALFDGQSRNGPALAGAIGRSFDNTRKHLDALVKSGLLVAGRDPQDNRRQIYPLAPSVKVAESPEGRTMDFGYCVMRL